MSEPRDPQAIYPRGGLVVSDGERLSVLGPQPGPAGVSNVELPDGSTWQVDHVDPGSFVQLDVDDADPGSSALLTAAFGGDGVLFMIEDAIRIDDVVDPLVLETGRPPPIGLPSRVRPRPPGVAENAGRVVLLADLAEDRRLHPLARIAAALEAANALARGRAGPVLEPLGPSLLDSAVRLADTFDDEELDLLDDEAVLALGDLCSTSQKIHERSATGHPGLERLLERVLWLTDRRPPLGIAAMRLAPTGPATEHREWELGGEVALSAAPPVFSTTRRRELEEPVMRRIGDSLVELTVTRGHGPRWVRVLRHGGFVSLGQAPLRRRGLVDVAEVVVPADVLDEELHVQVLDEFDLSRLADRPIDAIRVAIAAGREAARSDRLVETQTARSRWERCAQLWEHAGDRDRGALARELGEATRMHPVRRTGAVDRVAEVLASEV